MVHFKMSLLGLAWVLAGLALVEGTATAPQTTELFIVYAHIWTTDTVAASIVGNDATATTYSIHFPPEPTDSDTGPSDQQGLTVIAAPTTTSYMLSYSTFQLTAACSVGGSPTTTYSCTTTQTGQAYGPSSLSHVSSALHLLMMHVTITAGSVTPTGGVPQVTGDLGFVVAGAVVALAGAL